MAAAAVGAIGTRDDSRIRHDTVETPDGAISIPLNRIFADLPPLEKE